MRPDTAATRRISILLLCLAACCLWADAASAHGPDRALCHMDTSRGQVASTFGISACVDSSGRIVVLRNDLHFPVKIGLSGTGNPVAIPIDGGPAALMTRLIAHDSYVLVPGDLFRVPLADGAATITVRVSSFKTYSTYAIADALADVMGEKAFAKIYKSLTGMILELSDAVDHWSDCRRRHSSAVGKAACNALYVRDVGFAVGRAGVSALIKGGWAAALSGIDFAKGVKEKIDDVGFAVRATGTLRIGAVQAAAPPVDTTPVDNTPAPDTTPSAPPTPPTAGVPAPNVPAGTYAETAGGVAHTWTDPASAGGSEGPSIPGGATVGIACKLTGFRVADGNTWWYRIAASPWSGNYYVSADAFYNNGQTSGTLHGTPFVDPAVPDCYPATPPPAPAPTWSETVGGNANTWTNPANAGGSQGPTIPAFNTVQIACKLTGFRVADGNTWWYRIASPPWNGNYYVSADAFYNNGQTSGTLHGTPFVDPAVANC
jgi:hypothetical protein